MDLRLMIQKGFMPFWQKDIYPFGLKNTQNLLNGHGYCMKNRLDLNAAIYLNRDFNNFQKLIKKQNVKYLPGFFVQRYTNNPG